MTKKKSILHQEVHPVFQLFVLLIVLLGIVLIIVTAHDSQAAQLNPTAPQATSGY